MELLDNLHSLQEELNGILEIVRTNDDLELIADDWDSIAWYYYLCAEVEYKTSNKTACETIITAEKHMNKCFEYWVEHTQDDHNSRTLWNSHAAKIRSLKKKIEPMCRD